MSKISSLLNNKRFLMIASFILAVVIWLTISIIYSPESDRVITDVPVEIPLSTTVGTETMTAFSGQDATVKISVSGKKYVIEQLSSDSFTVTAGTDTVTNSGEYNLTLTAKKNSAMTDFQITSISPSTITVFLDVRKEVNLAVDIDCVGARVEKLNNENENMLLEPTFVDEQNSNITISGPETEVKQVADAKAVTKVNKLLTESTQYTAGVILYDVDGNTLYDASTGSGILKYTSCSYNSAEITANVRMRKTVPLKLDVKNGPETMPEMTIYEITGSDSTSEQQVSTVGIKGAADVISKIDSVTLDGTVDFSSISYDDPTSFSFKLTLPAISGVTYDEYTKVSNIYFLIDIDYTKYTSKSFDIPAANIAVTNCPEGKTVTVKTALKGVSVIGSIASVKKLDLNNLSVSIDANELITSGASNADPDIKILNYGDCWISGTYEVVAEIS